MPAKLLSLLAATATFFAILSPALVMCEETSAQASKGGPYFTVRSELSNSRIAFERTGKGRVAFLGGSITNMEGWRPLLYKYFEQRFPKTEFDFIHAGIPSMGSTPHAFRLDRDVFYRGPVDLLFVEAAVNDSSNERTPTEMVRGMEGIVRHARRMNPAIDIVFMHFVDPSKMSSYNSGKVPAVIRAHEQVAKRYDLTSLDLALEVTERINAGEFSWQKDFKNLHPAPFGQRLYAGSMQNMLETIWAGSLGADEKATTTSLPTPLDQHSYSRGHFVSIAKAQATGSWHLEASWKPSKGGTRAGFVNVPMLVADSSDGQAKFAFHGTTVGIHVAAGHDAGILEYSIDDGPWQSQDLFTHWSRSLHIPWLYILAAELPDGDHHVRLRMSKKKNAASDGTTCRIANFAVSGE